MAYPVISVDVMGGDHGPNVILDGIEKALAQRSDARFLLFGNEELVGPELARKPHLEAASAFKHCDMSVAMDTKPSIALRQGRKVSNLQLRSASIVDRTLRPWAAKGLSEAELAVAASAPATVAHWRWQRQR